MKIKSLKVILVHATPGVYRLCLFIGGTKYFGKYFAYPKEDSAVWRTNPQTGALWQENDLGSMFIGYSRWGEVKPDRASCYLEVDYTLEDA
jgi:hypothetical protein